MGRRPEASRAAETKRLDDPARHRTRDRRLAGPSGLAHEEIPLAGRIVSVADVFDALSHTRPYKQAWPIDRAVLEICAESAPQFDPAVVEMFETLDHEALVTPIATPNPARTA